MGKVLLVNSAMMPVDGVYWRQTITREKFCQKVIEASQAGCLESYIGYQQNLDLLYAWTGVALVPNREPMRLSQDVDFVLAMVLKYRVADPALKGAPVGEEDFDFIWIKYKPYY